MIPVFAEDTEEDTRTHNKWNKLSYFVGSHVSCRKDVLNEKMFTVCLVFAIAVGPEGDDMTRGKDAYEL